MTYSLIVGDCLNGLLGMDTESVDCCITSPPYWGLRDYNVAGQIGLEPGIEKYLDALSATFAEVRRVLKPQGTLWLNMGDAYAGAGGAGSWSIDRDGATTATRADLSATVPGSWANATGGRGQATAKTEGSGLKRKDLIGLPWRVALRLQADGWYLRSDIIWHKPNPCPSSAKDRPTTAHEYIFLLSKKRTYFYDWQAIATVPKYTPKGSRRITQDMTAPQLANKRTVWTVPTSRFEGAHFATFPEDLIRPCVLAGCPVDGTVLDPFTGSGTTGAVAIQEGRDFVGIELNPEYASIAAARLEAAAAAEIYSRGQTVLGAWGGSP